MSKQKLVICIKNAGYPASLELWKVYRVVPDDWADQHGMIRVIDESGEDYLYPANAFEPVELSQTARYVMHARHAMRFMHGVVQ